MQKAYLGGGCFWCLEAVYQRVKGVEKVLPGYAGGEEDSPSYQSIGTHAEIVEIEFNPEVISYSQLLEIFWAIHDPTTLNKQGNDVGPQYRSIILTVNEAQETDVQESIESVAKPLWGEGITTEVKTLNTFHVAEEYHHDYFNKNPEQGYCQVVINPKLAKFNEKFSYLTK